MASYLSQPKQFAAYQPEVNAELYGKLLMKKEADYQAGVEKVNKLYDYAATLPVVGEEKVKYLQQKVNQIHSYLNKDVNTDWSNQAVQKATAGLITSIAGDPVIQNAVADVAKIRKHMKMLDSDIEENGAAASNNKAYFEEKYLNPYLQSDINTSFKGEYTQYQDANKWANDTIKNIKPEWRKIDTPSTDMYQTDKNGKILKGRDGLPILKESSYLQWSKRTNEWEQVPPSEIKNVLELGIRNNPSIAKQLEIDAYSATKSFTEEQYSELMKDQRAQKVNFNNEYIDYLNSVKAGTSMPPDEYKNMNPEQRNSLIDAQVKKIQDKNTEYIKWDPENDKAIFRDPNNNEKIRNEYYKESFILQKQHEFGGKTKESITYEGDPFTKLLELMRFKEAARMNINTVNHERAVLDENIREYEQNRKDKLKEFALLHPELTAGNQIFSQQPASSRDLEDVNGRFHNQAVANKKQYEASKLKFIFDTQGEQAKQLIKKDPATGALSVIADASGSTVANQKKIDDILNGYLTAVSYGKNTDEKGTKISDETIKRVQGLIQQKNLVTVNDAAIEEMDNARKAAGKDRLDKMIDNLYHNFEQIAKKNGINATTQDLTNFFNQLNYNNITDKEGNKQNAFLQELLSPVVIKPAGKEDNRLVTSYDQSLINKFNQKFGAGSWQKYYKMYSTKDVYDVVVPSTDILREQINFNNDWLNTRHMVPVGVIQTHPITGKDDDVFFQRVKTAINGEGRLNTKTDENAIISSFFNQRDFKADLVQTWIDPTNDKKYIIIKHGDKTEIPIEITDPNFNDLFKDIPTAYNSALKQSILKNERLSTYSNGQPNWKESFIVGVETVGANKGKQIRQGLTYNSDGKYFIRHTFIGNNVEDAQLVSSDPLEDNLDAIAKDFDNRMIQNRTLQLLQK